MTNDSNESDWDEEEDVHNNESEEDKKPAARLSREKTGKERKHIKEEEQHHSSMSSHELSNNKKKTKKTDRRKRCRRVDFDSVDDEIDCVRAEDRQTERGGYFHTKDSRMKIAKANAGNVPWNKGKNRTETAKAKISAAIRARNRALLMEKLERLGMSEEVWLKKRKQIRLLRERVRKSRIVVDKFEKSLENEAEKKKKKARLETSEKVLQILTNELEDNEDEEENEDDHLQPQQDKIPKSSENRPNTDPNAITSGIDIPCTTTAASQSVPPPTTVSRLAREFVWTPHAFDNPDLSYDMFCHHGGPGGLNCCEPCTTQYSNFLSKTFRDMEWNRINNVGSEVKELLKCTREAKSQVAVSVQAVQRKPLSWSRKAPRMRTLNSNQDADATALDTEVENMCHESNITQTAMI